MTNILEAIDRGLRRVGEACDDSRATMEDAMRDAWGPPDERQAERQCDRIFKQVDAALAHNDPKEAQHQLERALYLSRKTMPPGNRYELAGQAGLDALKHAVPRTDISFLVDRILLRLDAVNEPVKWSHELPHIDVIVDEFDYAQTTEEQATRYCNELLGAYAYGAVLRGDADAARYHLERAYYMARKYIPGNDTAQSTAGYALYPVENGGNRSKLLEALEPMFERWKRQVDLVQ